MPLRSSKVIVVGAGVGGLACAIELATKGFDVRLFERSGCSGGKARSVTLGDATIDAGPTVLTMLWVFDELFARAGASFRREITLEKASILARHAWLDGTRLDLHADKARNADAIGALFGAGEAHAYLQFCADGRRLYETSESAFLRAQKPTMSGIIKRFGLAGLATFARLDGHRSMWRALEERFRSPKLRQLFGRYATYCGSSPFEAPATLNLIAHVESEGVYRARDGMVGLVVALENLASSLGVELLHGQPVDQILVEGGRATGVLVEETAHAADAVVFNGDVSALAIGLMGKRAAAAVPDTPEKARSLSAVTWAMRARTGEFPLVRHNVFFSDDYAAEFDSILHRGRAPREPTVYVCAQDREDHELDLPEERLLVLANAPATGDHPERWDESERQRCMTATMTLLERSGLRLEPRESVQTTPVEFHQMFPGTGGALYGPRSTGALSALSREGSRTTLERLYLAGGSVHPGPGVPMAALSGHLAANQILEDLGSTGRSRTAATSGTTSTE